MKTFMKKLLAAQVANDSWLCVGLDPDPARLPYAVQDAENPVLAFNQAIVEATADLVCAYKPNLAFYLALGLEGMQALQQTIACIPAHILVILDAKMNDVGHTARAYARAAFQTWQADAVTVNPYLGEDSIAPFLEHPDRAVFILARTSNPSSADIQDLRVLPPEGQQPPGGGQLDEYVAFLAQEWDQQGEGCCGLVVGATQERMLRRLREIAPRLPFLVPGVGAQGGVLEAAVEFGPTAEEVGPIINASRSIIYASSGEDFATAARAAAENLRQRIHHLLKSVR